MVVNRVHVKVKLVKQGRLGHVGEGEVRGVTYPGAWNDSPRCVEWLVRGVDRVAQVRGTTGEGRDFYTGRGGVSNFPRMAISHEVGKEFFVVDEASGEKACLEYNVSPENVMNMTRTFVPPAFRGSGMAARLVEAAMQYAESSHYEVLPTCSYISEKFLTKFPQYMKLVRK